MQTPPTPPVPPRPVVQIVCLVAMFVIGLASVMFEGVDTGMVRIIFVAMAVVAVGASIPGIARWFSR